MTQSWQICSRDLLCLGLDIATGRAAQKKGLSLPSGKLSPIGGSS
jgi:hypothetical protein